MATQSSSNVTISSKFDALSMIGTCSCVPPDVQVAKGPSYIVEMVNLGGGIYNPQGTLLKSFLLADFFGTGLDTISDPKVLYDAQSGNWFASLIDTTGSLNPTNLTIATTVTSDPTGLWRVYKIPGIPGLVDQPLIGVNNDKFVISGNDFASPNFAFMGAEYWVLNKVELLAGESVVDTQAFGPDSTLITAHPAQSLSSTSTEWMVSNVPRIAGHETFANNTVYLIALNGVPPYVTASRTSFAVTIGTYANGTIPGGIQPGTTYRINTNDIRIQDVSWFQGKLWFSVNDGCRPTGDTVFRSCFQLTQIETSTLSLKQEFDVGANGQSFFFPALRQDAFGNLIVIYGYSSSSRAGGTDIYPSLAVAGQASTDPVGSLTPSKTIVVGTANETRAVPGNVTRYGDYFGAAVDPSNPSVVWVAGEYHNITKGPRCFSACFNNWGTYVASVRMSPTNSASTPVTLSDFAISSGVSVMALGQNQKSNATMTVSSVNFAGAVSFSGSSGGATTTFAPSSVTLTKGGSATSILTSTGAPYSTGFDGITVTALGGGLRHSVIIVLFMTPLASRLNNVTTFHGVTVNTTGLISLDSPSNAFIVSGTLSTTAKNSSTGTVLYSNTYPVSKISFAVDSTGHYYQSEFLLTQWVNPYPVSVNIAMSYLVNQTGSGGGINATTITLTRNVDINLDGTVDAGDVNIQVASWQTSIGNPKYNPRADLDADGIVDQIDVNILQSYMGAADIIPAYTLSALNVIVFSSGSRGASTLTVTSTNGFSGSVGLTLILSPNEPNGPAVSMSPAGVSLSNGGFATSGLTISSTTSTPTGLYVVNLTASSGSQTHSLFFAIMIGPSPVNVAAVGSVGGANVTSFGDLAPDSGATNGLTASGSVTVVAMNASTGLQLYSYTYALSRLSIPLSGPISPGGSGTTFGFQRNLLLDIPVTNFPLTLEIRPYWSGPTITTLVAPSLHDKGVFRNPDFNMDGVFDNHDVQVLLTDQGCYKGTSCYDSRSDLYATGFTGFGSSIQFFIVRNVGATVFYPFAVSVYAATLNIFTGATGSSTITLASQGFAGTVTLSAASSGPSATLAVTHLMLTIGGTNTTTISITANVMRGNYTVTVTGSNGSQSASATISIRVSDFSISSQPTVIVFPRGSGSNATITVNSLNGFSGTVTLTGVYTPSGPSVSFVPASVTLASGAIRASTMTLSASMMATAGIYSFVVSGTSGSVSHNVTLIAAISVQFTINDRESFIGVNVTTTGTLSLDSGSNSIAVSGRLTTVATNGTTGAFISSKNYTLIHAAFFNYGSGTYKRIFILNVTATPTPLGVGITLSISAPTSSIPGTASQSLGLSRNPDVLEHGIVDFVDYSWASSRYNCSLGQSCYDPRADVANRGVIDIVDINRISYFYAALNLNS